MQNGPIMDENKTSFFGGFFQNLRQWCYPPEFRITPPIWPESCFSQLSQLAEQMAMQEGTHPGATLTENGPEAFDALLAEVATGLWRARKNMTQNNGEHPNEGMERPYRHVASVIDALEAEAVTLKDHTGEKWADGRAIVVLAFQETANLNAETIIETIRPSIFCKGRHIQMAQVIVGTPKRQEEGIS